MRLFTRIIFTAIVTIAAFSIVTYTACKQDKCKGIACINGGACQDGSCICPSGYTGTHCENAPVVITDPCTGVVCQNGGTCSGGTCTCPSGYEGVHCEIFQRDKFIGNYTVTEQCSVSGTVGPYTTTIVAATTNGVTITLNNFGDFSTALAVSGTVNGNNLTIPTQAISTYTISGSGTYSTASNTINLTYTVTATNSETCSAVWTKQ